jgi:hypothetical protein
MGSLKRGSVMGAIRMPTFWSYSRWSKYAKCKFFYACSSILKRYDKNTRKQVLIYPQPPSWPLEHGIEVHLKGEQYLRGNIAGVPKDFKDFHVEMRALKRMMAKPEVSLTVDRNWVPCEATDWDRAWLRAKADAEVIEDDVLLHSVDFKTGRESDSHEEQAEVCAVAEFAIYPAVKKVNSEFWYLDHGTTGTFEFDRKKHFEKLKKKWTANARKMLSVRSVDDLKPEPSEYACKWCPFRSDKVLANGQPGPCDAWRRVA